MKKTFRINKFEPVYRGRSFGATNDVVAQSDNSIIYQAASGGDRYEKLYFKDSNILYSKFLEPLFSSRDFKQPNYTFSPQMKEDLYECSHDRKKLIAASSAVLSFPFFNRKLHVVPTFTSEKEVTNGHIYYLTDRNTDDLVVTVEQALNLKRVAFETSDYISPEYDLFKRVLARMQTIIRKHNDDNPLDIIPYIGKSLDMIDATIMRPIVQKTIIVNLYEKLQDYINNRILLIKKAANSNTVTNSDILPREIKRVYDDINEINRSLRYIPVYKPLLTALRTHRVYKAYEHSLADIENTLFYISTYYPEIYGSDSIFNDKFELAVISGNINGKLWNVPINGLPIDINNFKSTYYRARSIKSLSLDSAMDQVKNPLKTTHLLETIQPIYQLFSEIDELDYSEAISLDLRQVQDIQIDQIPIEYATLFDQKINFELGAVNMKTFGDSVNLRANWLHAWHLSSEGSDNDYFIPKNVFSMNFVPIMDGIFRAKDFKGEDLAQGNTVDYDLGNGQVIRAANISHKVSTWTMQDLESGITQFYWTVKTDQRNGLDALPSVLRTTLNRFFDSGMNVNLHPTLRYALFKHSPFDQHPSPSIDDFIVFNMQGSLEESTISTKDENLAKTLNAEKNESDAQPVDPTEVIAV